MLNLSHLQLRKNSSFRQKKQGQDFLGGLFLFICFVLLFVCFLCFYHIVLYLISSCLSHESKQIFCFNHIFITFTSTFYFLFFIHSIFLLIHSRLSCQIEREVTEAMMKSLKYCDLQTDSARQPLYQYRAATIHHRLASMYHSCFRNQVGSYVKLYNSRKPFSFPFECLGCSLC